MSTVQAIRVYGVYKDEATRNYYTFFLFFAVNLKTNQALCTKRPNDGTTGTLKKLSPFLGSRYSSTIFHLFVMMQSYFPVVSGERHLGAGPPDTAIIIGERRANFRASVRCVFIAVVVDHLMDSFSVGARAGLRISNLKFKMLTDDTRRAWMRRRQKRQGPTAFRNKLFSSPAKPKLTIGRCEKTTNGSPVAL
jgi:hypothetical protein